MVVLVTAHLVAVIVENSKYFFKGVCMKFRLLIVLFSLSACISACGENNEVSFATLENARAAAGDNSKSNAVMWRTENAPGTKIKMRGDSTQSNKCPQGDGWASIDLLDSNGKIVKQLKCSTYSMNLGCVEKKDFESRSYAKEEGKCNHAVPFPLPKIGG
jgi:hypothetical protein